MASTLISSGSGMRTLGAREDDDDGVCASRCGEPRLRFRSRLVSGGGIDEAACARPCATGEKRFVGGA